jgi:hypothetical protein
LKSAARPSLTNVLCTWGQVNDRGLVL